MLVRLTPKGEELLEQGLRPFENSEARAERIEFEKLFGERGLREQPHVAGIEMVAWLHRKELRSKFWFKPPFDDHARAFSSPEGRTVFLQPYRDAARKELEMPVGVDEQLLLEGVLIESRKFADKHGLNVRVLKKPGWHSPKTVLIEYTARTISAANV